MNRNACSKQKEYASEKSIELHGSVGQSKQANIYTLGIPDREKKEMGTEYIFKEIKTESFANLEKIGSFRFRKLSKPQTG